MRVASVTIVLVLLSLSSAAATDQIQPQPDPIWSTYLTDITRSANGSFATLHDNLNNRDVRVNMTDDGRAFQLQYLSGAPRLSGTVTHIGPRDVVFRYGDTEYAIHLGQSLGQALEDPPATEKLQELKKATPPNPADKIYAFEMRNKQWENVLEWLTDQTGLRLTAKEMPSGKFTFIGPVNKTYTIGEIMDILNEKLVQEGSGFLLVRRDDSFNLVPVNEPIDPATLPRVKPEDLAQRGRYELVTVTVPLGTLDAGDVIADIRRFFSRFGNVSYLSRGNQLLLQDTAGNLSRVIEAIKEMEAQQPAKANVKTATIDFRDAPWPVVFAWLGEQTGLPVVSPTKPTGTFNFTGPADKAYTISEAIDIVNEALMSQHLMLIRRSHSFALVDWDEPVDPSLVPRIKIGELPTRGNSELVSLSMSLTSLSPDDAAAEVERVLGPLGRAIPLAKSNQLILQDTVGNLKRAIETIRAMEENALQRQRP